MSVVDERGSKEALHALWTSLDRAERVEGVPHDPQDLEDENRLIQAIRAYEANCDLESWKRSKRGE